VPERRSGPQPVPVLSSAPPMPFPRSPRRNAPSGPCGRPAPRHPPPRLPLRRTAGSGKLAAARLLAQAANCRGTPGRPACRRSCGSACPAGRSRGHPPRRDGAAGRADHGEGGNLEPKGGRAPSRTWCDQVRDVVTTASRSSGSRAARFVIVTPRRHEPAGAERAPQDPGGAAGRHHPRAGAENADALLPTSAPAACGSRSRPGRPSPEEARAAVRGRRRSIRTTRSAGSPSPGITGRSRGGGAAATPSPSGSGRARRAGGRGRGARRSGRGDPRLRRGARARRVLGGATRPSGRAPALRQNARPSSRSSGCSWGGSMAAPRNERPARRSRPASPRRGRAGGARGPPHGDAFLSLRAARQIPRRSCGGAAVAQRGRARRGRSPPRWRGVSTGGLFGGSKVCWSRSRPSSPRGRSRKSFATAREMWGQGRQREAARRSSPSRRRPAGRRPTSSPGGRGLPALRKAFRKELEIDLEDGDRPSCTSSPPGRASGT